MYKLGYHCTRLCCGQQLYRVLIGSNTVSQIFVLMLVSEFGILMILYLPY